MKRLFFFFLLVTFSFGDRICFFFSPENKIELTGKVYKIKENQSFCKSKYFVVLEIVDKSGKHFNVYISPGWFFRKRPGPGETVKIKGAFSSEDHSLIIAQWLYLRGEKIYLRDEWGFPLWRGRRLEIKKRWGKR